MTPRQDQFLRQIGEKIFTDADQSLFAFLSLDCNPMHVDPIVSRRLITGTPIVHGIHLLITAIEFWENNGGPSPCLIDCRFNSPVSINDRVQFFQANRDTATSIIEVIVNGQVCSKIILSTTLNQNQKLLSTQLSKQTDPEDIPSNLTSPLDESPQFHLHRSYRLKLTETDLSERFPRLNAYLGSTRSAALIALSYFVGMICPGMHSIFSSLTIDLTETSDPAHSLLLSVDNYDERFRLFNISLQGSIRGIIKAFLRHPPFQQPSLKDLSNDVKSGEFAGTTSLIIGGSRGLGEFTAKLLAAGGGNVIITYAHGLDDARVLRDQITRDSSGTCKIMKLDLNTDSLDSLRFDLPQLDTVYFFATPRIYKRKAEIFESDAFMLFYFFYVKRFYDLCHYIETNYRGSKYINVYFPSTVFISKRPEGMLEYSMSKLAAELMIEEINRHFKKLRVTSTRLPRLNSDQTSSILRTSNASNLESLLPIVRSLYKTA